MAQVIVLKYHLENIMAFLNSQTSQSSKFEHSYLQSLDFWVARTRLYQHFCLICSCSTCHISSLDFFCSVFFRTAICRWWFCHRGRCVAWRGHCSSGIADGGIIGAIVTYWITYCHLRGLLDILQGPAVKFASVQWWYIEVWCHACFVQSLLLLLTLTIEYEYGKAAWDSMYLDFHSTELPSVNQMGWPGCPALIASNVLSACHRSWTLS